MCGIAGFFDNRERAPVDGVLLRRMTNTLTHRGPDASGFFELTPFYHLECSSPSVLIAIELPDLPAAVTIHL